MRLVRHLLSVLLLPFVVVVVVPRWILGTDGGGRGIPASLSPVGAALGATVFAAGLALFTWCVLLFDRVGRGTLAPWDPTRRLVAVGPYRWTRNPMITGVAAMLLGEALFFRSVGVAGWLAGFVVVNQVYFVVVEEPGLERRFGDAYRDYRERVPRWLPRRPGDPASARRD